MSCQCRQNTEIQSVSKKWFWTSPNTSKIIASRVKLTQLSMLIQSDFRQTNLWTPKRQLEFQQLALKMHTAKQIKSWIKLSKTWLKDNRWRWPSSPVRLSSKASTCQFKNATTKAWDSLTDRSNHTSCRHLLIAATTALLEKFIVSNITNNKSFNRSKEERLLKNLWSLENAVLSNSRISTEVWVENEDLLFRRVQELLKLEVK